VNAIARGVRRVYAEGTVALGITAVVLSVVRLAAGDAWMWAGAAIAWIPITGYLLFLLIGRPSVRTRHLPLLDVVSGVGVALAVFAGPLAAVVAGAGLAATLGYQYWYSRQHVPKSGLRVGARIPSFPLTTLAGDAVDSAVLIGAPHVIMFYRGNWCPFCMVQVRQLAAGYRDLEARGVKVAMISPQRADETAELAARFDIPLEFFVDAGGEAARALDMVQAGGTPMIFGAGTDGNTVVPTVVITDDAGIVLWLAHADNHRVRPEPAVFLSVLDQAGILPD